MAPWDAIRTLILRLDTLISIYEARGLVAPTIAPTVVGVPGEPAPAAAPVQVAISTLSAPIATTWKATEPVEIYKASIRGTGVFVSKNFNWQKGKRLLIWVESTLDQSVQIQPKGNIRDNLPNATEMGPSIPCTSEGNISIGLAWDDWHPFIGVEITISTAPTKGVLKIEVVAQE